MTPAEFVIAVKEAVRPLTFSLAMEAIAETNNRFSVRKALEVGPERFEKYLDSLRLRVATTPSENRMKVEIPDKKREADSPLETVFSIHHVNLAYWMGRTLGEATRTLEDWQVAVHRVCGSPTPLGSMTAGQCRDVLVASGLFTPTTVPSNTEHMTQRIN